MAIERNDLNTLNNVQIKSENNRAFYADVRSLMFFTKDFAISPTYITEPKDLLELNVSGLDENHIFYKLIASAYSQSYTPLNVVVYGNNTATTFTELMKTYVDHEDAFEVTNWITNMDIVAEKNYIDSIIAYAKTDKDKQFFIAVNYEKLGNSAKAVALQTDNNVDNVAFVIEGAKNLAKGNWLTGALVGGTVGYKDLGSYIVHSTQINGFVQENFTKTEQKAFWDAGLNYLSKPTQGYFHVVNGINSDSKTLIELKLIEIWLRDGLKKDLTIFQVRKDKIPLNDTGRLMIESIIRERCRQGANAGMFMVDNAGSYFGIITQKDKNGNEINIKLGHLTVDEITQESIREGKFKFDLKVTYLNGVRYVSLTGAITTDGEIIFNK
ncbi:hypothetical protein [uncultured Leptotrichia sp.]|jgi:hypothetical protein|uniref:hypothetical protein n=1 Tax=uncultured Leptotrichia sp. TaxID=159271 RepID=UPI00262F4584|nr:hypothetical protein [uncultured Leptotrichia sp.]